MLQADLAVDMGEEVDCDAGTNAFFVAEEKHFFERGEVGTFDSEENLVDDLLAQDLGKFADGTNAMGAVELNGGGAWRCGDEAGESDAIVGGALQHAAQANGALACSDHEHVAAPEPANGAGETHGEQAKQKKKDTAIDGEDPDKNAAEFEPKQEFEHQEAKRAKHGLPERIAKNRAPAAVTEPFMNIEPPAGGNPGENAKGEDERSGGDVELVRKREREPGIESGLEGQTGKNNIRDGEQDFGFARLAAERHA